MTLFAAFLSKTVVLLAGYNSFPTATADRALYCPVEPEETHDIGAVEKVYFRCYVVHQLVDFLG